MITLLLLALAAPHSTGARARIEADAGEGRPLVAHVFVALADNDAQAIVPVHAKIGDGQDAKNNLYWGARYGVATYLEKDAGWRRVARTPDPAPGVLERLVLQKRIGKRTIYLVADAWDGREIGTTIERFLRAAAGHDVELVDARGRELAAGGAAHVVAYVGHDGLMELDVPDPPPAPADAPARSAIVLACISKSYFGPRLETAGAHALLTTTSLMAPEAYTLDAALSAHFAGKAPAEVHARAGEAYCRYQRCSAAAGRRMFAYDP